MTTSVRQRRIIATVRYTARRLRWISMDWLGFAVAMLCGLVAAAAGFQIEIAIGQGMYASLIFSVAVGVAFICGNITGSAERANELNEIYRCMSPWKFASMINGGKCEDSPTTSPGEQQPTSRGSLILSLAKRIVSGYFAPLTKKS